MENVKQLTEIVGKHVYENEYLDEEDYLMMVIEYVREMLNCTLFWLSDRKITKK